MASDDIPLKSELESFREQWRAEVRSKVPGSKNEQQHQSNAGSSRLANLTRPGKTTKAAVPKNAGPKTVASGAKRQVQHHEEEDEFVQTRVFDEPYAADHVLGESGDFKGKGREDRPKDDEPVSALDHYEKAVEREVAGNLGDSLALYRKAFRMDHRVDLKYKNKHFPAPLAPKPTGSSSSSSGTQVNPSNAAPTVTNTAHHSLDGQPLSMKELIASFSGLVIEPRQPEIEGDPVPPCPISELPDEILVHILRDVAVLDIASFVRLARVCKRLAYLVATEDQTWRRVCLGTEFGFGGMHYRWQKSVTWGAINVEEDEATETGPPGLEEEEEDAADDEQAVNAKATIQDLIPLTPAQRAAREAAEKTATTLSLFDSVYKTSWQRMFRLRPRIRFGGCYISTVNYIRSGQASTNQVTWGSPVHIVTYYRYLRFYRDGTAISLLTTAEPADVVHHVTRNALMLHREGASAHLPTVVMQSALKGRWKLGSGEREGELFVETEGVGKYMYRLDLRFANAGKGTKNGKLVWRGFYSYNRLTDDWSEFGLKNDKPFFFSRVRSYGLGE